MRILERILRLPATTGLAVQNLKYWLWRKRNPDQPFATYFADIAKADFSKGKPHPSLGRDEPNAGRGAFRKALEYGLQPNDVCVDYGCGTLRLGRHLIDYLEPGHYWGLDVDDDLLELGRTLAGPDLLTAKAPKICRVSPQAVEEAAASRPKLLLSFKVLIHVHPAELEHYIKNITTIIGTTGTAVITGKWSPDETYQFARQSWAHSFKSITELVRKPGGDLSLSETRDYWFSELRRPAIKGVLLIRPPQSGPA